MNIMKKEKFTNVIKLPNPSSWYSAIRTTDVCRILGKFRSNESPYSLTEFLQSTMYSRYMPTKFYFMLVGFFPGVSLYRVPRDVMSIDCKLSREISHLTR